MTGVRRTILVVGGLAAGPSAASKAARTDPAARVVLFEQTDAISYGICEIPYYLSGELREEDLVVHTAESLRREKGVDVQLLSRVEEIMPSRRRIRVRDLAAGRVYEESYDRLILATGARPKVLGLDGENARNVFPVRSLDGAKALHRFLAGERPQRAVIIGAGYVGVEMAEALRTRGLDVTLLHNAELPLCGMETPAREWIRDELAAHRVNWVPSAAVVGLKVGDRQAVTHVLTPDRTFPAELVIVAIGVEPNAGLAAGAGIRTGVHGGILTDRRQATSAENVFAAGDCCEVRNLVTNRWMYAPLATLASRAAWVAGENAAGGRAFFSGALRASLVKVFSQEAVRVGVSTKEAAEAGLSPVAETILARSRAGNMPGAERLLVTLIADRRTGKLIGGNIAGQDGAGLRGHALTLGIQQGMTVDAFRSADFAYAPSFSPLWDPLLVAANALARSL
jgi:NADPH-dependent 2,4-dienoyl-CoA reductase/sulfur reductase-like enzyme